MIDSILIRHRQLGPQYYYFFEGWILIFLFENSIHYFELGMLLSNDDLEGQQNHNVQEVKM